MFNDIYVVYIQELNAKEDNQIYAIYKSKKKAIKKTKQIKENEKYSSWVLKYKIGEVSFGIFNYIK